jgi:hypothetical protein
MREEIVPTKSAIVLADSKIVSVGSEIVSVKFERVLMKFRSVSEYRRFNYGPTLAAAALCCLGRG